MHVMYRNLRSQLSQQAELRRHLKSKHAKYVDENFEFFKEKKHQVKHSRIDRISLLP